MVDFLLQQQHFPYHWTLPNDKTIISKGGIKNLFHSYLSSSFGKVCGAVILKSSCSETIYLQLTFTKV